MRPFKFFYSFFVLSMSLLFGASAMASGTVSLALDGGVPFTCSNSIYVVAGDTEGQLYYVDTTDPDNYDYVEIGAPYFEPYNALGYNTIDNFLYAINNLTEDDTNSLLRIDSNGDVENLGEVDGLPKGNWNSGVFDGSGNYYVKANGAAGIYYKIDVVALTAEAIAYPDGMNTYDFAWNPENDFMYGMSLFGQFFRFKADDPMNTTELIGTAHGTGVFGGLMATSTGEVYGFQHRTGMDFSVGFYQFDLGNGFPEKKSDAPASVNGDMAFCTGSTFFECDDTIYVVAGNDHGQLYTVDTSVPSNYVYTELGAPYPHPYNALGYNKADNFLYAMINLTEGMNNHLLRIDNLGNISDLGAVTNLPEGNWNAGVFDDEGNYYIRSSSANGRYFKVNVATRTAVEIPFPHNINEYDFAWDPTNRKMYAMSVQGQFFSFDADNPAGTLVEIGAPHGSAIFGGMMADSNGNIYGFQHREGLDLPVGFYKFNKETGQPTKLSDAPASVNGDMAFCPDAEFLDGGDPFECDDTIYVVAGDHNGQLYYVDISVPNNYEYIEIGEAYPEPYNALGYNVQDNYLYGMINKSEEGRNNHLLKIDSNGDVTDLGAVTNLPEGNWNSGVFDDLGNYYIRESGAGGAMYKVNVATRTAEEISFSHNINDYDYAWNPADRRIYAMSLLGQFFSFDPNDPENTLVLIGAEHGSGVFGGMMATSTGRIFGFQHRNGMDFAPGFYEFNKTTGMPHKISDAPTSVNGDMAFCPDSDILISECDNTIYIVAGNDEAQLYWVDTSSGSPYTYVEIGEPYAKPYNAMGYNLADHNLYAIINLDDPQNDNLLMIDKDTGVVTNLGAVDGLPHDNWNSGVFDGSGNYYVRAEGPDKNLFKIDVAGMTAEEIVFDEFINEYDFAWNPKDGMLYGVSMYGQLFKFDPADVEGTFERIGDPHGSGIFGGMMADSSGRVFGFQHRKYMDLPVGFYEFDTDLGTPMFLSDAPYSQNGDMAFCVQGELDITCNIELQAEIVGMATDCVNAGDVYSVEVTLNGSAGYADFNLVDDEGTFMTINIGQTVTLEYAAGTSPNISVYGNHEATSDCTAEVSVESPAYCEEIECDVTLTATSLFDGDCYDETTSTYEVEVLLTGTAMSPDFILIDDVGGVYEIELNVPFIIEYPVGVSTWFYAYGATEETGDCGDDSAFVESPISCEDLAAEEPCDWIVRVWSVTNGTGTSWSFVDGNGDLAAGVADHGPTYNDIEYFTAAGPATFTLDVTGDGYRSVNYNVFRNGKKIHAATVRNQVLVLDNLSCDDTDDRFLNAISDFDITYHPNPANDVLFINSSMEVENVQAFNMAGKQVMSKTKGLKADLNQVDVSTLPVGIYVFRATLADGTSETFKVIIKR